MPNFGNLAVGASSIGRKWSNSLMQAIAIWEERDKARKQQERQANVDALNEELIRARIAEMQNKPQPETPDQKRKYDLDTYRSKKEIDKEFETPKDTKSKDKFQVSRNGITLTADSPEELRKRMIEMDMPFYEEDKPKQLTEDQAINDAAGIMAARKEANQQFSFEPEALTNLGDTLQGIFPEPTVAPAPKSNPLFDLIKPPAKPLFQQSQAQPQEESDSEIAKAQAKVASGEWTKEKYNAWLEQWMNQ